MPPSGKIDKIGKLVKAFVVIDASKWKGMDYEEKV